MKLDNIPNNFIHKFLPKNSTQKLTQMILVCAPSCVGKTYFLTRIEQSSQAWNIKWRSVNSTQKFNSKNNVYPNRSAILLGISGSEYQKRLKERGEFTHKCTEIALNAKLTLYYNEWIETLDSNQVPYIFVEARNNYPVIDRLNFFKLLKCQN